MGSEEHAIERCQICDKSHPHNQARGACDKCRSMIEQSERDIKEGRTMTIDEVIPDPHPDTTELTTLYDASDGGTAEWWPGHIERVIDIINGEIVLKWKYTDPVEISQFNIVESHALDIIRGSAERWLRGRGWNKIHLAHDDEAKWWKLGEEGHSLADAIRVEMGREG